jgi:hypothetical protein
VDRKGIGTVKITETQVARPVVAYFGDLGYDVYQEVKIGGREAVADIVATLGKRVVVVECKTSLSLAVIEQAVGWRGFANWVYVATPNARVVKGRWVANSILAYFGIGHIETAVFSGQCSIRLDATLDRKARTNRVLESLVDAHRTYAEAGNSNGRHWSPFKQTCENLSCYVRTQHLQLPLRPWLPGSWPEKSPVFVSDSETIINADCILWTLR